MVLLLLLLLLLKHNSSRVMPRNCRHLCKPQRRSINLAEPRSLKTLTTTMNMKTLRHQRLHHQRQQRLHHQLTQRQILHQRQHLRMRQRQRILRQRMTRSHQKCLPVLLFRYWETRRKNRKQRLSHLVV